MGERHSEGFRGFVNHDWFIPEGEEGDELHKQRCEFAKRIPAQFPLLFAKEFYWTPFEDFVTNSFMQEWEAHYLGMVNDPQA